MSHLKSARYDYSVPGHEGADYQHYSTVEMKKEVEELEFIEGRSSTLQMDLEEYFKKASVRGKSHTAARNP